MSELDNAIATVMRMCKDATEREIDAIELVVGKAKRLRNIELHFSAIMQNVEMLNMLIGREKNNGKYT